MSEGDDIASGSKPSPGDSHGRPYEIDRRAIRHARQSAAKKAKRIIRQRYDDIVAARPAGSGSHDHILKRATALYRDGPISRRDLPGAIAQLQAALTRDLPDVVVQRAPRSVSATPEHVGLSLFETRVITQGSDRFISAESHCVVLEHDRVVFTSGMLPGGTRPHLFERVIERSGRTRTMAEVQLQLSAVWPTLLWMRSEQRRAGRGAPIRVTITPFADGLLFGSIEKIIGLPPAGPMLVTIDGLGQEERRAHDFYGDVTGDRLCVMTNTYVDDTLLAPEQRQLRKMLGRFVAEFSDVVEEGDWRWRIGLGVNDPAVQAVAQTFRLRLASDARRQAGLAALEAIVMSEPWQRVAAETLASQERRRKP